MPVSDSRHGVPGPRPDVSVPPARISRRPTVVVVTRERGTREQLLGTLSRAGCSVQSADSAATARKNFEESRPDLLVIDFDLPDGAGWELLSFVRSVSWLPVLVHSAVTRESDKVRALQLGADDYVVKPVGNSEFAARVLALLRRAGKIDRPSVLTAPAVGDLHIDPVERVVTKAGKVVDLTPTEFRLLVSLCAEPGALRSTRELLEAAWGDPWGEGTNRVKYAVLRLRKKLEAASGDPLTIDNRRGFGYRVVSAAGPPADND